MDRDDGTGPGGAGAFGLLAALPEGVAHLGPDGAVRFLNPAGERILAVTPGAWRGRNLLELAQIHGGPGRTQPLDLAAVFDHLAGGRPWKREAAWIHRTADGRALPAAYSFARIEGEGDGAVFLFRDVSDRQRAERAMQEARVGLAAASGVEAAKNTLLSGVSRDLFAPVDALVASAERLAQAGLPAGLSGEVDALRSSARHVVGVISDLMDWSRVESGVLSLQPVEFDLRAALGEVVDSMRPAAEAKGLSLDSEFEMDGTYRVLADPGRVRQVAHRFLSHALRMTSRGAIRARLETTWRTRTDATLRLSVEHGGPSVCDTAMPRAGAAPSSPTDVRMGLALACRIMDRMDGVVGGETRDDGTAVSWFELRAPLARTREPDLRGADLRGVRTLVVESSDVGRDRLVAQLAAAGLRCSSTGSGGQALRQLRAAVDEWDPYRIAVLSAPLREMDAATLGDLVKGDPRLRDTVLVYLASVGETGDASRMESIGFSAYLVKPVRDDVLRSALSVVWAGALLHTDGPFVTRHTLRDSRILKLTPDEIRDRVARPASAEPGIPDTVSARHRGA